VWPGWASGLTLGGVSTLKISRTGRRAALAGLAGAVVVAVAIACATDNGIVASAVSQPAPPGLSVDELRDDFARRGYVVDAATAWEWLSPPVTTFRVQDPHTDRVLLVQVFPDAARAAVASRRAAPIPCYAARAWISNVALLQADGETLRACMAARVRTGMAPDPYDDPLDLDPNHRPNGVDAEFISVAAQLAERL
jgi:hypothetical protein